MGYRELLQALEDEVGRQIRERRAEASRECERLLDATRQELAAMREKVLDEERQRLEEESARALSRARLEMEHAILAEARRQTAELLREAEVRLPAMNDADVLTRLVDEIVPELDTGPVEFQVRAGQEDHLRAHLSRRHPGLVPRATIIGSPNVRGGVAVSLGGRQILDNTLPSRLQNAWRLLEPEIVAILFGEGHGGP
jgi:vacuolar-type H+-ATPase subunit E/Vma4